MTTHSENQPLVVLVAVSGGISAYKVVDLVSRLQKTGAEVHVAMTSAAQRFVEPLTFESVSGRKVLTDLFPPENTDRIEDRFPHLYPSTQADCFILAPATADRMAKIVHGVGDDIVTAGILSLPPSCLRFFCPAMNVEMWHNPVVQRNVAAMETDGWSRIGPDAGELACGQQGEGRMAEPDEIYDTVQHGLQRARSLTGRKVMILSGPTREHLDPVRFIGNPSSGKLGKALALQAVLCGAEVEFITGPVDDTQVPRGQRISIHRVLDARQMLEVAERFYDDTDIIIYAAAVSDYRPEHCHELKQPKNMENFSLSLCPTPDIAATLNSRKKEGQWTVGFALESRKGREQALDKLHRKHFDAIVLNQPDAMGADDANFEFCSAHDERGFVNWGKISKKICAHRLLDEVIDLALPAPSISE